MKTSFANRNKLTFDVRYVRNVFFCNRFNCTYPMSTFKRGGNEEEERRRGVHRNEISELFLFGFDLNDEKKM